MATLTSDQIARVRRVPHLAAGHYANLDIAQTIEFYSKRYVRQLAPFRAVDSRTTIADIGAGYGWLAMAFALETPARLIAVDADAERLEAGREIAGILGVADRIEWRAGLLGSLDLPDRCADVVYCIEVLEHVYRAPRALPDLARLSRDLVIATTPNGWFPVIAHDTELPFCHMLPRPIRHPYAKLFGRTSRENDNLFWSPRSLARGLHGFERVSSFLHYASLDDYVATYPFYLPYGRGSFERAPSRAKLAYYRAASRLGRASYVAMPNLAGVFRRRRPAPA